MDDLDRMYRRLVENIRAAFPQYEGRPFEVSEVYQTIIPYRHNRRELALETNQDYELTLMRLLSGERGYLAGDAEMQDAVRRELSSPNPDLLAYRGYATTLVSVAAALAAPTKPPEPPKPSIDPRASSPAARMTPPPIPPSPVPAVKVTPPTVATQKPPPFVAQRPQAAILATGGSCRYCGGALPDGRKITFCPHCGQNMTVRSCPACGTELEVTWRFCTTCGRELGAMT